MCMIGLTAAQRFFSDLCLCLDMDVKDVTKGSWIWPKLIKLKPTAYLILIFNDHTGVDTFSFFDDMLQVGRFIKMTGEHGI
ncbi:unnamed protein product [Thlaspi arvense]|uniref:Uncharacterized protein n=1 Tax=Thlaspi arvense TaxID=13288 RepID=A0AAU9SIH7_THLAR|nr:unnamed protein product [Thlaspi arvense]